MNEHKKYYELMEKIKAGVKTLSDEDIEFAYWLNYTHNNEEGYVENLLYAEYLKRKGK